MSSKTERWLLPKIEGKHLMMHDCLEIDNLRPIDLTNDIHPVFRQSNFMGLTARTYNNIRPALQLASNFLSENTMLEFYVRLAYGSVVHDPSRYDYLEYPSSTPGDEGVALAEVKAALEEFSKYVYFAFDYNEENRHDAYGAVAMIEPYKEPKSWEPASKVFAQEHGKLEFTTQVELHPDFEKFAANGFDSSTECQRMRFQFLLAATMMHEISHAFWRLRNGPSLEQYKAEYSNGRYPEPYYINAQTGSNPELGTSWEVFALGFTISTMDYRCAPTNALIGNKWQTGQETAEHGQQYYVLPMQWINQWFQSSFWERISLYGRSTIPAPDVTLSGLHKPKQSWTITSRRGGVIESLTYLVGINRHMDDDGKEEVLESLEEEGDEESGHEWVDME